jgi:hypothetical protein
MAARTEAAAVLGTFSISMRVASLVVVLLAIKLYTHAIYTHAVGMHWIRSRLRVINTERRPGRSS